MNKQRVERTKRRAHNGDPMASYELAHYWATLPSASKHRQDCVTLLEFASSKGESRAQYALGNWYLHGIGVKKSFKSANALLLRAAKQGHPLAQFDLAVSLEKGKGVKKTWPKPSSGIRRQQIRVTSMLKWRWRAAVFTESALVQMLPPGCFGRARRRGGAIAKHNSRSQIVTKMELASDETNVGPSFGGLALEGHPPGSCHNT